MYCGRELRAVLDGRQGAGDALRRYDEFSAGHSLPFACMYAAQQSVPRLHGPVMDGLVRTFGHRRLSAWAFRHYLDVAPPSAALPAPPEARAALSAAAA